MTSNAQLRRQRRLRRRLGMSLMELLIVMGVLSTVVALSWPALRRPLNRSHAQTAAQQLQRDLLATRRAAMESGQVHWFQYLSTTGTYYCGTNRQFDLASAGQEESAETTRVAAENEDSSDKMDRQFELPEGTSFVSQEAVSVDSKKGRSNRIKAGSGRKTDDEDTSKSETARTRRTDRAVESATVGWSRPLRFYPSGRMESGQISLANQDGYDILVEIQGLAGRVKIHSLQRNDVKADETTKGDRDTARNTVRETRKSELPKPSSSPRRSRSD